MGCGGDNGSVRCDSGSGIYMGVWNVGSGMSMGVWDVLVVLECGMW